MHQLAPQVVLSRSGLVRLVDRVEAAGLVERERCLTDRRGAYAVLTPDGEAMLRRMWPVYEAAIAEWFADAGRGRRPHARRHPHARAGRRSLT